MKKTAVLSMVLALSLSACSPQIHLDFLGQDRIEEITLLASRAKDKILVVDIEGVLSSTAGSSPLSREGNILSQVYLRLEKAAEDPDIKGIIMRLETPGGEVAISDIIYNEVLKFKQKTRRPVLALMMSAAASGGYYIASACDYLIAHPMSVTGSIGVISVFPDMASLLGKIGVGVNVVKSGRMKDAGSPFRSMDEAEKKIFQEMIDEYYERFLDVVYKGRREAISRETLHQIGDGRIYTAKQALELKLIDEIGYFDSALKKILTMAGLHEARVIAYSYYPKTRTNLYAAARKEDLTVEFGKLENLLPNLKSGFYYLWLPGGEKD
jgi:protease-4